ncbi:MAG: hypothetical protein VR66_17150 [Peptococcaceae bacterium BRH_c23]|nr:MAG: hypothetical protein VR66_17150 [Peptococcaceae bacterium BRH_c23]KJS81640.1 MAG: hypothetical protein JL57_26255 [Desulfosporosinus sp. BICA1-9]
MRAVRAVRAVTMIPATVSQFSPLRVSATTKKRVAAYARVSTDSEEQQSSYEAQVNYYTRFIQEKKTGSLSMFIRMKVYQPPTPRGGTALNG